MQKLCIIPTLLITNTILYFCESCDEPLMIRKKNNNIVKITYRLSYRVRNSWDWSSCLRTSKFKTRPEDDLYTEMRNLQKRKHFTLIFITGVTPQRHSKFFSIMFLFESCNGVCVISELFTIYDNNNNCLATERILPLKWLQCLKTK